MQFSETAYAGYTSVTRRTLRTNWFQADLTAEIIDRGLYVEVIHKLEPIDEADGQRRSKRLGF